MAEVCPVCKGAGKFLIPTNLTIPYTERVCHGCNGLGWIGIPK